MQRTVVLLLMLLVQIGSTLLNIADVISDIWVLVKYYEDDKLRGIFYGSLFIMILNTLFLMFLGIFVELLEDKPRYSNNRVLNNLCSILLSFLQLRLYVETYYVIVSYMEELKQRKSDPNIPDPLLSFRGTNDFSTNRGMTEFEKRSRIRAAVSLMNSIFYAAPQLMIQTFVVLQYDKTDFLHIASVVMTSVSLAGVMALYSCKEDPLDIIGIAAFFLLGQLGLRTISIVVTCASYKGYALLYVAFIWLTSIIWSIALRLSSKSESQKERFLVAIIISPMFMLFTVNTAGHEIDRGNAKASFVNKRMIPFVLWRAAECLCGVFIGVYFPVWEKNIPEPVDVLSFTAVALALYFVGYIILYVLAPDRSALERSPELRDIDIAFEQL